MIIGFILNFDSPEVTVRVASSFISVEQAQRNLAEVKGRSFDRIRLAGREAWNKVLGRIHVEGGTEDERTTFYSALYRCLLFPRRFYEEDASGNFVHYSPYSGEIA